MNTEKTGKQIRTLLRPNGKREGVLAVLLSCFFSAMQLISHAYRTDGSLQGLFGERRALLHTGLLFLAGAAVVYVATIVLFRLIDRFAVPEDGYVRKKRRVVIGVIILLLCWLPYFFVFFPGTANADTSHQMAMFNQRITPAVRLTPGLPEQFFVTNHYPYLTTVMYGLMGRFGIWIGDIRIVIAAATLIQMALCAGVFTLSLEYLASRGVPRRWTQACFLFFAFVPIVPVTVICLLKDVLFSLLLITYTLQIFEMIRSRGVYLVRKRNLFFFVLNTVLLIFIRSNGIFCVIPAVLVLFYIQKKQIIPIIASIFIPLLFYQTIWMNAILPALHVAPAGRQEAIGVLFQQSARYVVDHPEDVSEDERAALRAVIDYDRIPELYDPEKHDPVKYTFNQNATDEEMHAYYRAWLSMFKKHPASYIHAVMNTVYPFYDLVDQPKQLYYSYFVNRVEEDDPLYVDPDRQKRVGDRINRWCEKISRIPVIGLLLHFSFYIWVVLFAIICFIRKARRDLIVCSMPMITCVLIQWISPLASYRYSIPEILAGGIFCCLCATREAAPSKDSARAPA